MAYLDGELPADRAGVAAGHLQHCRECQNLAADLQVVSAAPAGMASRRGASLRLSQKQIGPPKTSRTISRWAWALAGTGMAAILLISSLQLVPADKESKSGPAIDTMQMPAVKSQSPVAATH